MLSVFLLLKNVRRLTVRGLNYLEYPEKQSVSQEASITAPRGGT